MKFRVISVVFVFILSGSLNASKIDSLKKENTDSTKLNIYFELFKGYYFSRSDSAIVFASEGIKFSKKINDQPSLALFHNACGQYYIQKGNYALALEHHLNALRLREKLNNKKDVASSLNNIGLVYQNIGEYNKS